jgi:hypothetical protein
MKGIGGIYTEVYLRGHRDRRRVYGGWFLRNTEKRGKEHG